MHTLSATKKQNGWRLCGDVEDVGQGGVVVVGEQREERALTKQQGAVLMLRMRRGDPAGAAEPDKKFHLAGKRCSTSKHRLSSTPGTASSRYYARHVGLEA